jgi:hypothetical protein
MIFVPDMKSIGTVESGMKMLTQGSIFMQQ